MIVGRLAHARQVCPANWTPGGKTIVPTADQSLDYFGGLTEGPEGEAGGGGDGGGEKEGGGRGMGAAGWLWRRRGQRTGSGFGEQAGGREEGERFQSGVQKHENTFASML